MYKIKNDKLENMWYTVEKSIVKNIKFHKKIELLNPSLMDSLGNMTE